MSITAKQVNELRKATGAGMMDCKKALVEADGDFDKAVDILRKKGQKVSAKRADREASEGAVFIATAEDQTRVAVIELNCETDFVARNEDFQTLGSAIAELALAENPADLSALKALSLGGRPVSEALIDAMGKIGEKIDVSKYENIVGEKVVSYVHPGARIGVAVAFSNVNGENIGEVGKDVAMQIAAMNPIAIDEGDVSPSVIEKEKEIGMEQARASGRPENILEKIAMGKVKKYLKENTLLNQAYVKDTSRNVGQYIKDSLGKEATVIDFKRIQLGA